MCLEWPAALGRLPKERRSHLQIKFIGDNSEIKPGPLVYKYSTEVFCKPCLLGQIDCRELPYEKSCKILSIITETQTSVLAYRHKMPRLRDYNVAR